MDIELEDVNIFSDVKNFSMKTVNGIKELRAQLFQYRPSDSNFSGFLWIERNKLLGFTLCKRDSERKIFCIDPKVMNMKQDLALGNVFPDWIWKAKDPKILYISYSEIAMVHTYDIETGTEDHRYFVQDLPDDGQGLAYVLVALRADNLYFVNTSLNNLTIHNTATKSNIVTGKLNFSNANKNASQDTFIRDETIEINISASTSYSHDNWPFFILRTKRLKGSARLEILRKINYETGDITDPWIYTTRKSQTPCTASFMLALKSNLVVVDTTNINRNYYCLMDVRDYSIKDRHLLKDFFASRSINKSISNLCLNGVEYLLDTPVNTEIDGAWVLLAVKGHRFHRVVVRSSLPLATQWFVHGWWAYKNRMVVRLRKKNNWFDMHHLIEFK